MKYLPQGWNNPSMKETTTCNQTRVIERTHILRPRHRAHAVPRYSFPHTLQSSHPLQLSLHTHTHTHTQNPQPTIHFLCPGFHIRVDRREKCNLEAAKLNFHRPCSFFHWPECIPRLTMPKARRSQKHPRFQIWFQPENSKLITLDACWNC
jgi:hypothetical protein